MPWPAPASDPTAIRAVWVGSESHPYAVKPTSTIVAEAIGAVPATQAADWEFACKAGTEAFQAAIGFVGSGMADYALAIGMDTAQGRPGDALEYTAGAGGAAFLLGPGETSLAIVEASFSYVSDTPDFFRRPYQHFPQHGSRFTGDPAYFKHVLAAGSPVSWKSWAPVPTDYAFAVFHQPNPKFPESVPPSCWASSRTRPAPACSAPWSATPMPAPPCWGSPPSWTRPSPVTASCSFPSDQAPAAMPFPSPSPTRL